MFLYWSLLANPVHRDGVSKKLTCGEAGGASREGCREVNTDEWNGYTGASRDIFSRSIRARALCDVYITKLAP